MTSARTSCWTANTITDNFDSDGVNQEIGYGISTFRNKRRAAEWRAGIQHTLR